MSSSSRSSKSIYSFEYCAQVKWISQGILPVWSCSRAKHLQMCISKRICRGSFSLSVLPTFLLADEHLEKEFDTVCTLYSAPLRATLNIGTLWRCWNSEWTLARQGDLGHHFCKFGKQRLLTACTSGFTLKVHFQEKTTKREARKTLLLVAL